MEVHPADALPKNKPQQYHNHRITIWIVHVVLTWIWFCEVASNSFLKRWCRVSALRVCSYILSVVIAPCIHIRTHSHTQWHALEEWMTTNLWWFATWQTLPPQTNITSLEKKKYCHAFHAFYVQLLNISAKTLAVSPKGVRWIMANTRELCVQEKQTKHLI